MFSLILATGIVYGSAWTVRQVPKLAIPFLGLLLGKERQKVADFKRQATVGFDIVRDSAHRYVILALSPEELHVNIQWMAGYHVFTEEELFLLSSANQALLTGKDVAGANAVDFQRLSEISAARQADEEFMELISKD